MRPPSLGAASSDLIDDTALPPSWSDVLLTSSLRFRLCIFRNEICTRIKVAIVKMYSRCRLEMTRQDIIQFSKPS